MCVEQTRGIFLAIFSRDRLFYEKQAGKPLVCRKFARCKYRLNVYLWQQRCLFTVVETRVRENARNSEKGSHVCGFLKARKSGRTISGVENHTRSCKRAKEKKETLYFPCINSYIPWKIKARLIIGLVRIQCVSPAGIFKRCTIELSDVLFLM